MSDVLRQLGSHRRGRARRKQITVAYVLMAPAIVLVLGVIVYPLGWEVWVSLTDWSIRNAAPPAFVGLRNYALMFEDPDFWRTVGTTGLYVVLVTAAKLGLGTGLAMLLARPTPLRGLAFVAVFLPWAYPGGVAVIAWYWMLNPPLNTSYSALAGQLKQAIDGLAGTGAWSLLSVALFNVWRGGSFTAVFLLAGINAVPTELFEYALLETTGAWQRFWEVTLPLLRPYLALALYLSLTTAFADLANVWMLTGGRLVFPLLGTRAYWLGIYSGHLAEAAAWSLSLVPLLGLALLILFARFDRAQEQPA